MSQKFEVELEDNTIDDLTQQAQNLSNSYNQRQQEEADRRQVKEEEEKQALDEQFDPRNADSWGAKAFIKEGQSILSGGLQDTASSIATFPERTFDALSGEMQRERELTGEYKPEWTPFNGYDNPIETKTWWGKQLRGLVHFGSLAAGTILAAKGAAAAGVVSVPASLAGLASSSM